MLRQFPIAMCVRVTLSAVLLFLAAPPVATGAQVGGAGDRAGVSDDFVPVTDAMLQDPAPEDWLMWRRTLDSWGYSPLDLKVSQAEDVIQAMGTSVTSPRRSFSWVVRRVRA